MAITTLSMSYLLLAALVAPSPSQAPKPASTRRTPATVVQRSTSAIPEPMTREQAFFYYLAINGIFPGAGDQYARLFDRNNYDRAMADEFERGRYRDRMQSKVAAGVASINFDTKFSLKVWGYIGEYSFTRHAFPLLRFAEETKRKCLDFNDLGGGWDWKSICPLTLENATNTADFNWFLAMPEAAASNHVKKNTLRAVSAVMIYSVVPEKTGTGQTVFFRSKIHSISMFSNEGDESFGNLTRVGETIEEIQAKADAPAKLRALLASLPQLRADRSSTSEFYLRVTAFDVATDAVTAEIKWSNGFNPPTTGILTGAAVGADLKLSGSWEFNNTYFKRMDPYSVTLELRFDGLKQGLEGTVYSETEALVNRYRIIGGRREGSAFLPLPRN